MNQDLIDILMLDIPSPESQMMGFLEIAGKAHSENVNSNVYAYFLDSANESGCSDLFYQALMDLILEKLPVNKDPDKLGLEDYRVYREYASENGNRIDIVLDDPANEQAIIIENKIYHIPINPFDDYWAAFSYPEDQKVGVLLTLHPTPLDGSLAEHFVNITHQEWVNRIQSMGLPSGLDTRHYIYLNDFFHTIEELSKSDTMNEQAEFFFKHHKKILNAIACRDQAIQYLQDQIETAAQGLEGGWMSDLKRDGFRYIQFNSPVEDIYYTVYFKDLLEGEKKITIILDTWKQAHALRDEFMALLKEDGRYDSFQPGWNNSARSSHLIAENIEIEEAEQLNGLASAITALINTRFEGIRRELNEYMLSKGLKLSN